MLGVGQLTRNDAPKQSVIISYPQIVQLNPFEALQKVSHTDYN